MKRLALLALLALFAWLALASCAAHRRAEPPRAAAETWPFEIVALRHAQAQKLAGLLGRMELSEPETRVIADARTNSLVIQGPDEGRRAARELIGLLDVEQGR